MMRWAWTIGCGVALACGPTDDAASSGEGGDAGGAVAGSTAAAATSDPASSSGTPGADVTSSDSGDPSGGVVEGTSTGEPPSTAGCQAMQFRVLDHQGLSGKSCPNAEDEVFSDARSVQSWLDAHCGVEGCWLESCDPAPMVNFNARRLVMGAGWSYQGCFAEFEWSVHECDDRVPVDYVYNAYGNCLAIITGHETIDIRDTGLPIEIYGQTAYYPD